MTVLYRKYRPRQFQDVEGQEHVVRTLQGAILLNKVSHAYLFCGPRGTGKTTLARLLAKTLNCQAPATSEKNRTIEPCGQCLSCTEINDGRSLDVIEIDAASNRGIDEIRNLKESAQVASMSSRHKIFIVDEVHMLTPTASNALLKILEEPPTHIIFILATTEAHKVLETIMSRVQRFDFTTIGLDQIKAKLQKIAKQEKLTIVAGVYDTVVSMARGSLRDAESVFGKLIAYTDTQLTHEKAREILGIVPAEAYTRLTQLLHDRQATAAIAHVESLYQQGYNLDEFSRYFIGHLRDQLLASVSAPSTPSSSQRLIAMIRLFTQARQDMKTAPIPQLPLELAILEACKDV